MKNKKCLKTGLFHIVILAKTLLFEDIISAAISEFTTRRIRRAYQCHTTGVRGS